MLFLQVSCYHFSTWTQPRIPTRSRVTTLFRYDLLPLVRGNRKYGGQNQLAVCRFIFSLFLTLTYLLAYAGLLHVEHRSYTASPFHRFPHSVFVIPRTRTSLRRPGMYDILMIRFHSHPRFPLVTFRLVVSQPLQWQDLRRLVYVISRVGQKNQFSRWQNFYNSIQVMIIAHYMRSPFLPATFITNGTPILCEHHVEFSRGVTAAKRNEPWSIDSDSEDGPYPCTP